jgi:hypothetical protein
MKKATLRRTTRRWLLTGILLAVALGLILSRRQITRRFSTDLFLVSKNPSEEVF